MTRVGNSPRGPTRVQPTAIELSNPPEKTIVRQAVVAEVLTQAEYAQISAIRQRAAGALGSAISDLQNLEALLAGGAAGALASRAQSVGPARITYFRSPLAGVTVAPVTSPSQSPSEILSTLSNKGIPDRSFASIVPVTCPNGIDDVGNSYDAGSVYDAWLLNPSIDAKIDFDKPPSQNTPFIPANTYMNFQVRKQKVFYLAQNAGTEGVMQAWLLRF